MELDKNRRLAIATAFKLKLEELQTEFNASSGEIYATAANFFKDNKTTDQIDVVIEGADRFRYQADPPKAE